MNLLMERFGGGAPAGGVGVRNGKGSKTGRRALAGTGL